MRIPLQEKLSCPLMPGHQSVLPSPSALDTTALIILDICPGLTLDVSNRTIRSKAGQYYRVPKFFVKEVKHQIIKGQLVVTAICGDYSVEFRLSHPWAYVCQEQDRITYTECVRQLDNARPAGL